MLEKSSTKPHSRLINLFDILEDWLDAPAISEQINVASTNKKNTRRLQDFLTIEAAKAGAAMPQVLADQLYFMAVAATQEKLQANNIASLSHAKSAANALILAQTKKEFHIKKSAVYAIAASFFAVVIGTGSLLTLNSEKSPNLIALSQPTLQTVKNDDEFPLLASPEQTAALVAQLELMRHGNCQLIEAIQLPDSQKGIYINMIVNGHVSTDPKEQIIALDLIKRTRCNYTPMLMANSKG